MTVPVVTNLPPMPPLGNDTVTFITLARDPNGVPDSAGMIQPTEVDVDVENCRHRPIPATTPAQREQPEDITDIAQQVWQTHAPPVPAALNAGVTGRMRVNGIVYQILGGVAPVTDADGNVVFLKILSEVQKDNPNADAGRI